MSQELESKYQLLLNLNNAIINKTNRNELFQEIGKELKRIFKYDRFSINLYNKDNNTLNLFSSADGIVPTELDRYERPLEHGPISKYVIETREPLIINNLKDYFHWSSAKALYKSGLESTVACPLIIRNTVLGSMNISFKNIPPNMEYISDLFIEISGQVALAVDNLLNQQELQSLNEKLSQQKNYLQKEVENDYNTDRFFFKSSQMWDVIGQLEIFAETDDPILITGETGTGKDYLARYVHNLSHRQDGMFVKVSCPSLAPGLFESELFGHSKGAFTGANTKKIGRLEMANGGTLFLDEIGELPLTLQAKLLQVLQEYTFERVGDTQPIKVNFRIIAATNIDLMKSISDSEFRSDLFYRLETLRVNIPPLRERVEDIPYLIHKINEVEALKANKKPPYYSPDAINILKNYSWPGNVRELKNLVKRFIILKSGEQVKSLDVQGMIKNGSSYDQHNSDLRNEQLAISEVERKHIEHVLKLTKGKISGSEGAATLLNLNRTTLQYRLKKYNINPHLYK